jgi:hypothetical protein
MQWPTLLLLAASMLQQRADRFAITDLTALRVQPVSLLGTGFIARADSARISFMCPSCTGAPILDVLLGRQDDGTEGRVRSGVTSFTTLDSLCRSRNPSCTVSGLNVPPAVGWISSYRFGPQSANTVVVMRGGDLLTIRSIAGDSAVARRNADRLVARLVPRVVGQ